MLVLQNKQFLRTDGIVLVPPFQAGHLGFIPGRSVEVYLLRQHEKPPANCEVVITTFPTERRNGELLRLNCVMKEEKGVVQKLLKALAVLKINVVAQESCAIHHQDFHKVSLVVDFSTSPINRKIQSSKETLGFYRMESAVVPLNQDKYVELFETIMAYCGDVIAWSESRDLPRMTMHPFEADEPAAIHAPATILTRSASYKKKRGVMINLENGIANSIRSTLAAKSGSVPYFMVSDTEYRKLRIIFPRLDQVDRMIHVGFFHNDVPGALDSILNALSKNNFNIFTSLHRTVTSTGSTWEAILEYYGKDMPGATARYRDVCEWLSKKMVNGLSKVEFVDLDEKEVRVGAPLHPKPSGSLQFQPIPLDRVKPIKGGSRRSLVNAITYTEETNHALRETITRMENGDKDNLSPINMLKRIIKRRETKVKLFLSYPSTAKAHAKIVKDKIESAHPGVFEIDEFQDPNANYITDTVVAKIKDCSGFIGIWHHEVDPSSGGISTWMPFEFGLAYMASKEWIVVRSEAVPERIWKRITPHYSMVSYTDVNFEARAVEQIVSWCNEKFLL